MILFFLIGASAFELTKPNLKIVQFTDLHYGETDEQDISNIALQRDILDWEQPDLVIFTGDLTCPWEWRGEDGWFKRNWELFVKPMKEKKIPWAITLGNHDIESDLTGRQVVELDMTEPLSLSRNGPEQVSHASNYYIPVFRDKTLVYILWFLDTGNRDDCWGLQGYDCLHSNQVQWFKDTQQALFDGAGRNVQGFLFMHIPPPEYMTLWNDQATKGHRFEDVSCWANHTQYFIKELHHIDGVTVGHDHFNDFWGTFEDKKLFYGRKSGAGAPGPAPYFQRGARIFDIYPEQNKVESWIRQEDGSIYRSYERLGNSDWQERCAESSGYSIRFYTYFRFVISSGIIIIFGSLAFLTMKSLGYKNFMKDERLKM
jgi:3',5'-cyclic AMP phosphodiesterase CpdA